MWGVAAEEGFGPPELYNNTSNIRSYSDEKGFTSPRRPSYNRGGISARTNVGQNDVGPEDGLTTLLPLSL